MQIGMTIKYQEKIIILWIVFLLGLLFHTQLGLMPLFHGLSVADSQARDMAEIAPILWAMLGFFVLPMVAIVATLFTDSKRYRTIHFGFTVLYTVSNFFHLLADLTVTPVLWYQVFLMMILAIVGLLINLVSFQWMREPSNNREWRKQVSQSK
jgi:hypothetical protein